MYKDVLRDFRGVLRMTQNVLKRYGTAEPTAGDIEKELTRSSESMIDAHEKIMDELERATKMWQESDAKLASAQEKIAAMQKVIEGGVSGNVKQFCEGVNRAMDLAEHIPGACGYRFDSCEIIESSYECPKFEPGKDGKCRFLSAKTGR